MATQLDRLKAIDNIIRGALNNVSGTHLEQASSHIEAAIREEETRQHGVDATRQRIIDEIRAIHRQFDDIARKQRTGEATSANILRELNDLKKWEESIFKKTDEQGKQTELWVTNQSLALTIFERERTYMTRQLQDREERREEAPARTSERRKAKRREAA